MPERPALDHELVVLVGEELRTFDLAARAEVTLGRDGTNHVRIDHPSVSRRHAVLRIGSPMVIEDLGGANGTFVRDGNHPDVAGMTQKLRRLVRETAELGFGESVLLGAVSVVVRHRPEATAVGVIIQDANMRALYAQAERAAAALISVLLLGETGVGKELFARAIHTRSPRANGSTFLEISKSSFRPIPIVGAPAAVLAAFAAVAGPLHRRLVANERESQILASIRDALLPRLLSGELSVKTAEHAVEASA